MSFKYKNYEIIIVDDKITYKFKDSEEEYFSIGFLNSIIMKADKEQTYFNGLNLEVLRYIKFYLLPMYYYNKGQQYYIDYHVNSNKNIIRPYMVYIY